MTKKGEKRALPSEPQMRALRVLVDAGVPMKSSDLGDRAGLFAGELRSACNWLAANGFITSTLKRERVQVGHSRVMKSMAYWQPTDRGRALSNSASHGNGPTSESGEEPQQHGRPPSD